MTEFKFKKPENNSIHVDLISMLFHLRTQIHIKHLQTGSFAEHKALNKLYDAVLDIADELAETIQGKLGSRLKGYSSYPFKDDINITDSINEHIKYIMTYRSQLVLPLWSNIDNQLQVLQDKLEGTLYLLTLK